MISALTKLQNSSLRTGVRVAYTQGLLCPSRLMIIQVVQYATPLLAYKYPGHCKMYDLLIPRGQTSSSPWDRPPHPPRTNLLIFR
ncbi:hypothetical protein F511_46616 [Dorcoceras hygrometricum]|uniref:Uncharacterized protein n=1 Tax=Dorcoceras hygrometricum TaxID=472368 RepID=A0A2Z7A0G0_9LAMI|nr:hypothetical protein F511_46616 [Dorcoceras hygrometricum]